MMKFPSPLLRAMIVTGLTVGLVACSGGGGTGGSTPIAMAPPPPPPPPPPTSSDPTWTPGQFAPSSDFEARCENPRTGVDSEGNAFPDTQGSTTIENFWLRSWSNETYLFNTEITDRNPASFSDRLAYFDVLRTTATTASGEDKDDFHFSQPTTEFLESRNSTPRSGYGARITAFSQSVPRDFRILYTEPNSPAGASVNGLTNFPRGARILEIDGVDLVNGGSTQAELDILNNGLFPATAGESHTFRIREAGTNAEREVTLISEDIATAPVNRTRIINTPTGDVGYMLFNTFSPFSSEEALATAFTNFRAQGINDLVLDLRYNGGGLLAVSAQLAYMVAGDARTSGRTYSQLQFNAAAGGRNPITGAAIDPIPFINTGVGFSVPDGQALDSVDLPRLYILSTEGTCSASEAVINGLDGINFEIILIGDTTCGKPFGFFPTDNCGETYFTIQFRSINDSGFGDYSDGFSPSNSSDTFAEILDGCVVADDLENELGDENEALLSTALFHRANGTCPAVNSSKSSQKPQYFSAANSKILSNSIIAEDTVFEEGLDATGIGDLK